MSFGGAHLGGSLAVVAASALATVAATGSSLYVSSSATAAVQVQAARSCGADLGVRVLVPPDGAPVEALRAGARTIDDTAAPIETWTLTGATFTIRGRDDGLLRRITLMHRPGQERELGAPVPDLAAGDAVLPVWAAEQLGLRPGDVLDVGYPVRGAGPGALSLRTAGTYPAVPVQPPPAFFCGLVNHFKPDAKGDYPDPVAFVSADTLAPLVRAGAALAQWELRPDTGGITRDEAAHLATRFDALGSSYVDAQGHLPGLPRLQISVPPRLGALVGRAEQVATTVSRTVGPVTVAGAVATSAVLAAAGLLVARARRRELRLLAVRGTPPVRVWATLARALAAPVALGVAVGLPATLAAVAGFGPAAQIEPRVLRRAAVWSLVAGLAALALLVAVATGSARRLVDAPVVRRHRWLRWVPWELAAVGAAAVAYRRLDRLGGVQLVGAEAVGGDVVAQAYPLLLLVAALAVTARPMAAVARASRFVGRRWRPSLQLGVRRVVAEPGVSVGLLLATALAVASLVSARVLTDSAVQALSDKARTYVGSDLAVRTDGPAEGLPPELAARVTTVARQDVRADGASVQVLAVDPDTFARVASWRGDEADTSLAAVLGRLRDPVPSGTLAALVVGAPLASAVLTGPAGAEVRVTPVGTLRTFPGFRNPGPLVVVDRAALARSELSSGFEVWVRRPPADVLTQLRAAGLRVYSSSSTDDVFDVSSFLAVRWSYALLGAFGAVIGAVTALAHLLVLDARRRSRQAAYVLAKRMGLGPRHQFAALLVEVGAPVVAASLAGLALGVASGRTSVARLDTLRNLQPVTRAVVAPGAATAVVAAAVAAALLLAAWGTVVVLRTRPVEVMRETA